MVAKHAGMISLAESEAACKVCKTGWVDVNRLLLTMYLPLATSSLHMQDAY